MRRDADATRATITGYSYTGLQYFRSTQQNANVWYHWSNLGKIQWNHVFNDKLFAQFRLAENFNQYIFDQPFEHRDDQRRHHAGRAGTADRTQAPRSPGTPAARRPGLGFQDEYSDRRSQMYFANLDLTFTRERALDVLLRASATSATTAPSTITTTAAATRRRPASARSTSTARIPNLFLAVDYPLTLPDFYFGTKQTFGKLTRRAVAALRRGDVPHPEPARRHRPEHGRSSQELRVRAVQHARAGARASRSPGPPSPYDAIRGSYGVTTTFVPAAYVFNNSPNGVTAQDGRAISPYYPGHEPHATSATTTSTCRTRTRCATASTRSASRRSTATRSTSSSRPRPYTINPVTGARDARAGTTFFRPASRTRRRASSSAGTTSCAATASRRISPATYVNYWGSVTPGALAGGTPYGSITSNAFSIRTLPARVPRDADAVPQPVAAAVERVAGPATTAGPLPRRSRS